ncbi:MAG: ABC transporter ATP-binding protein [Spirochaetales bacterium]
MAAIMEVRGLRKEFAVAGAGPTGGPPVVALDGVDLQVEEGTIFVLLGPNGAGKSTMVRVLNGTLGATAGSCRVAGMGPGDPGVRALSATLTESAHLYENLTCADNLKFFGTMYGLKGKSLEGRVAELLATFGLTDAADRAWGACSTGMKKRLQLARALLHDPKILFLDEPTSGLDPEAADQMAELVVRLCREQGKTIFLCTHNLPLGEALGDTFGFLKQGRLVLQGPAQQLIDAAWTDRRVRLRTSSGVREETWSHEADLAALVRAAVAAGESVYELTPLKPNLNDVYRSVMGLPVLAKKGGNHAVVSD